ncbi:hypothetical protein [Microbulbifer halophilus]|uniref:Uncharacterized protein n=1 Tax=Microbulbifer halophilus TaxID=453963 RepID=A0ABW5EJW5_9GAMM|nr:hypothetical protein [Microbulbifer halophilus]MCW8127397.1 hypothetical protein [Microbulbifer halophilus]
MHQSIIAAGLAVLLLLPTAGAAAKPNKELPPGLQKKVERGGELPPGWRKKLEVGTILGHEIYRHGVVVKPVDRQGVVTISIEGEIIRLIHNTREIVEILSH